ncbi:hypothetical protein COJ83_26060 [Bacillus cereus]|jgi:hypothetical protein|nr:hypothetical protein COJ13_27280 [Bacillus cereus]PFO63144.1 hypothetical protein COJ83_26060 [Bacillus cereus]PFQ67916.1 hypothetical protein COK18_03465 [Bacillus cereus]PGW93438.1 hypothetical protein COE32_17565 [Bacillus cereus]PGY45159.1 hypothetical protein COE06_02545 [Bacillus cereus]
MYTHCYDTLRNSNKNMRPIKPYKNQKNPKTGNILWKLSMVNLLGDIKDYNISLAYIEGKT